MPDHLDRETSVSVALSETGIKAKARSRFVAAVDRFGGNLVELINAPLERKVARERAISAGEAKFIGAVTKFGIEKLQHDPEFTGRAVETYFQRVFEKQENKDGVLREALEDLRHELPAETEADAGPARLDEEFLNRFEPYAESASNEQLRQKWGRVLSAEVKRPGTFSAKVMRIVDELEPETAKLFEALCRSAIETAVPKCLVGILPFHDVVRLVSAGLMVDPGMAGHVAEFREATTSAQKQIWMFRAPGRAVSVPKDVPMEQLALPDFVGPLQLNGDKAAIPVYLLTAVGAAIARIFPENEAFSSYIAKVKEAMPDVEVVEYVSEPDGTYRSISST